MGFIRNSIVGFFAVLMCWSFTLYAEDGEIVEQTRFAPGTLKRIEGGLRGTVAEALRKRENPIENCNYPGDIIFT